MMKIIHISSSSWEAPYLEKPDFHPNLDFCYFKKGQLVGILSGHQIQKKSNSIFSAEILAVHPEFQSLGIAKALLKYFFELNFSTKPELHLWTRDPKAKSFYENHLQLPRINSLLLSKENKNNQQFWVSKATEPANIWNYKLTSEASFIES